MGSISFKQNNSKKILFLSNTTLSLYRFRLGIMLDMQSQGFDVFCMAKDDGFGGFIEKAGIRFIPLPSLQNRVSLILDIINIIQIYHQARRIRPDFVFQYSIKPNIFGSLVNALLQIPCICVVAGLGYPFHGKSILNRIASTLYKTAMKICQEAWFLNSHDLDYFVNNRIAPLSKVKLIPGEGVNTQYYHPFKPENASRSEKITFLFTGRILWEKGIQEYIEAARIMLSKYAHVQFNIMGFTEENSNRSVPIAKILEWVSEDIVQYFGPQEDVRPVMWESDCVVLPTFYGEGLSRTLLEAGSMEIPVITTRHPGCQDVVIDGITGFICEPKSVDDLVNKMELFIKKSLTERNIMGQNARKRISRYFREEIITSIYHERLNKIIKEKKKKNQPSRVH